MGHSMSWAKTNPETKQNMIKYCTFRILERRIDTNTETQNI